MEFRISLFLEDFGKWVIVHEVAENLRAKLGLIHLVFLFSNVYKQ